MGSLNPFRVLGGLLFAVMTEMHFHRVPGEPVPISLRKNLSAMKTSKLVFTRFRQRRTCSVSRWGHRSPL